MNLALLFLYRDLTRTFIERIDFDIEEEVFIFVKGKSKERVVKELGVSKEEVAKDCVYFDKQTGEPFATMGRGNWYNEELLFYLLKQNNN